MVNIFSQFNVCESDPNYVHSIDAFEIIDQLISLFLHLYKEQILVFICGNESGWVQVSVDFADKPPGELQLVLCCVIKRDGQVLIFRHILINQPLDEFLIAIELSTLTLNFFDLSLDCLVNFPGLLIHVIFFHLLHLDLQLLI